MTQPSPAAVLKAALRMDFRAADLGDTAAEFDARLDYIVTNALARLSVQPPATPTQAEAGARYLLISAQIRQLTRQADELRAASGASIKQDLSTRIAALRVDQQAALTASGLTPSRQQQGSLNLPVESWF